MGRFFDRLALRAAIFALGFLYFRLAVPSAWGAAALALVLCLLASYLIGKKWPLIRKDGQRFRLSNLASRKRAPACALYGAIYMALYLWLGQIVYLPLALVLLFLAGMGFHRKDPQQETMEGCGRPSDAVV